VIDKWDGGTLSLDFQLMSCEDGDVVVVESGVKAAGRGYGSRGEEVCSKARVQTKC